MKKFINTACILFSVSMAVAQQNPTYLYDDSADMRDHPLDFERMRLYVEFEPAKALVKGKVTHFFTPLRAAVDSFFLDGPGIRIQSAALNGKAITYKTNSEGITFYPEKTLTWGRKDSLVITYEATPRKGIYFIGWNDAAGISRKQIWTQGQGIDNRHWFPCYDTPNDKLITEVIVKFDKAYKVLSNGIKVLEKEQKDGTKLWHYKMTKPHASYLLMLGIGNYEIKETKSKSGVLLRQWYYPEWKDRYEYSYKYNEKIFDFLESEIGVPYPWESYSQIPVQDFMFGAMENTSATLFGDFFLVDARSYNDRNYVSVNAHELAHQWFGDYVTARSGTSHWLQESFATHYNLIAERECFGNDHFDWGRRQSHLAAIGVKDKKPISHTGANSTIIYQKGSQVLEMLKYVTGREAYNKSVKRYLLAHPYANVDSDDLLNAFQDELGMALEWFWDEWVYRGGEPTYEVSFEDITTNGKRYAQFAVSQTQLKTDVIGLFKMPFDFEVHFKDGSVTKKTEWIEKENQMVKVPLDGGKEIAYVLFDPNSRVIKTVSFNKSFEMLKEQAAKAPNMLDRYDAVYAMRSIPFEKKRDLFKQLYDQNTFHAIKNEIVSQLVNDAQSGDLVKKALNDKDVQVRKATVLATSVISANMVSDYERLLNDSSYITIAAVLEKLCTTLPSNISAYLQKTKGIEGTNGRNVLIKWLELSAMYQQDEAAIKQLQNLTSDSYEFLTRANAMAALRKMNIFNETVLFNCMNAAVSNNGRLSGPAAETIRYFYAQNKFKNMIASGIAMSDYGARDKETLLRLLN
jgi:aminopeptidase N